MGGREKNRLNVRYWYAFLKLLSLMEKHLPRSSCDRRGGNVWHMCLSGGQVRGAAGSRFKMCPWACRNGPLHSTYISCSPTAVVKYNDQKQLTEGIFFGIYGSRGIMVHHAWEAWKQAGAVSREANWELTSSMLGTKQKSKLENGGSFKLSKP